MSFLYLGNVWAMVSKLWTVVSKVWAMVNKVWIYLGGWSKKYEFCSSTRYELWKVKYEHFI